MTDAAGNLPQVGVELVARNSAEFKRAVDEANRSLGGLTTSLGHVRPEFTKAMTAAVAFGTVLGNVFTNVMAQAALTLRQFTIEAVNTAARFQQLQQVAYLQGQQQGKTAEQMDELIAKIRSYGIEASVAADQVIQFTRYELDLSKATDLARVAQDAAVLTGENSSATLSRLMWGIQTYNTEVFRSAGLTIRIDQAFEKYAKTLNKSTSELTSAERSMAVMNEVLEEGKKVAGAYETSLNTPAKILASMPRIINDIQVALGTPFLAGLTNFAKALYEGGKAVTALLEKGGALHPVITQLGAVFNAFGEIFKETFSPENIIRFGTWLARVLEQFINFAAPMLEYGLNVTAQFAAGIIEGITAFLVPAINMIADVLSWLMAPGSPPRFLPDIDEWGRGAMNAFLEGFSEADYSALSSLEGIFQSALSGLGVEKPEGLFRELSQGLIQALSTGVDSDYLNKVRSALGGYGEEVAELVDLQLKLAWANEKVQKAEDALKKSRKEESTAQKNLTKIIEDYNKMVSEGASKEQIDAKRKEFEAAKNTRDIASKARKDAEDNLENLGDEREELNKKVSLQKQLVEQMIKLTAVQKEASKGGGLGVGAAKGITPIKVTPPKIDNALSEATARIRAALAKAFAPLSNLWNDPEGPIAKIREAFDRLGRIDFSGLQVVAKAFQDIKNSGIIEVIGKVVADFLVIQGLLTLGGPLLKGIGSFFLSLAGGKTIMEGLNIALGAAGTGFAGLGTKIVMLLGGPIPAMIIAIASVVEAWDHFISKTNEAGNKAVSGAWTKFFADLKGKGADAEAIFDEFSAATSRVNDEAGKLNIANAFVDWKTGAVESLKGLSKALLSTGTDYDNYRKKMLTAYYESKANEGMLTLPLGDAQQAEEWMEALAAKGLVLTRSNYDLAVSTGAASTAMQNGTGPAAGLATSVDKVKQAAAESVTKVKDMVTELETLTQRQLDLESRQKDWLTTTASKVETMLGQQLPEGSERFAKGLQTLDTVYGTMKVKEKETSDALADAVKKFAETGDVKSFQSSLEQMRDQGLKPLKDEALLTEQKIKDLKTAIENMPQEVKTQVYVDIQYPEMPDWLKKLLNGTLLTNVQGSGGGPGGVPLMAAGGDVQAGQPYVVGERGRELFIPDMNGQILPNNLLGELFASVNMGISMLLRAQRVAQVAKAMILPVMAGGGGSETNYNLTLQTTMRAQTVRQGFELMRVLGG